MIPIINILSEEGLFISIIAVLLNIIIAYGYPILHSILPNNIKKIFSSYQNVILVHRQNLLASSLFAVILIISTIVLAPIIEKLLQTNQQTQPSILNLANLIKSN